MIYYTNVSFDKPHMVFVGRWSPFHQGHVAIIEKKRRDNPGKPILMLVRERKREKYSACFRAEIVKLWMKKNKIKGTIMIIPDIEGIYWGRKVGYKTQMVPVDGEIKKISGTAIRNSIVNGEKFWQRQIAHQDLSHLLTPKASQIMEKGLVVWLTGCPCSGKTTLSNRLAKKIKKIYPYLKVQQLDGDVIRGTAMAKGIGFSPQARNLHIKRMAQLAKMLADQGVLVLAAFVSPYRKMRSQAKKTIGKDRFLEVYVKASLKTRIKRDKKGMYAKAEKGEISNFTGYNAPYEEANKADIVCDTERQMIKQNVDKIFKSIFKNGK
jgi:adenylylsulfate kinase